MVRAVLGVVAGYVVMAILVFSIFSLAYLLIGADAAFQPGTYEVTPLWLVISFVFSFLAAVVGGWICAAVARRSTAAKGFAAVVFILGLILAASVLMDSSNNRPREREGAVGNIAAMQNAKQPAWVAFVNALIAPAGILLGARLKGQKMPREPLAPANS
jgi:hypothetical protein